MTIKTADLISLDEARSLDQDLVGAKAATLAHLRQSGLPAPPGVVVPAGILATSQVHDMESLLGEVESVLGDGPWAVRSSGVGEDSADRSFAGQYVTTLNVTADDLGEALLRTHRSSESDHVRAYAEDQQEVGGIPVLIQPMIDATAAGVAFTVDPVTGDAVTTVEAVSGLGEALVSGEADPERWQIDNDVVTAPSRPDVLDESQARDVADLARRVEDVAGAAQDIEWAIAGENVVLLQARPITGATAPELIPIDVEVPPGTWVTDASHQPRPPKPITYFSFEESVMPTAFAEFGVMVDDVKFTLIGGWAYAQFQPLGAPAPKDGGGTPRTPPRWLLALAMKMHPAIRRRARAARSAIESDLAGDYREQWRHEWRSELAEDIDRALDLDLTSLSDEELQAEFDHRLDVARRAALIHTRLGVAVTLPLYRLTLTCRRLLGWDDRETLQLLEGLSDASTAPARHIGPLVELARDVPDLADAITSSRPDLDHIRAIHPEFGAAFDQYVRAVGHRALEYQPESPTLAETPHILLGVVADHVRDDIDPESAQRSVAERRAAAERRAREGLKRHTETERAEFEKRLTKAQSAYPVREDNEWYTTSAQIALQRYLILEMGQRLADRGQVESSDDVFFVEYRDLETALLDGRDLHQVVTENKGRWAWAMAHPGPEVYGAIADFEPPFEALPPEARLINEAAMWSISTSLGGDVPEGEGGALTGVPASSGRYTGTARIVHGEQDFGKIQPGDVVICPATSPVWSIVYPSMGALVTDSGGVLSHPAIIARENGIPAVVGTKMATTTYQDGEIVTVDGDTGTVQHAQVG